ncbi:MAG: MFS transporter [Chlamydiales bacterium]|nr:MFS transporter [Chlamydiales bacterium]
MGSLSNKLCIATVILLDLLVGMEFDLFVPSFPQIEHYFGLTPFWVEASLSVNFLGYCISLLFVGSLADRFGRKPVVVAGLVQFILGCMLSLVATEYWLFLLGRFLQGIGVAAPTILSFLVIADQFPLKKQQFYMAVLNSVMNISVAVAPVLGSYITLYSNWQGNFIALSILGMIALIMSALFIPKLQNCPQTAPVGYLALSRHQRADTE